MNLVYATLVCCVQRFDNNFNDKDRVKHYK